MLASPSRLQGLAGVGFVSLVLVWIWTALRKNRYSCEDSHAETVLVRNYRRHLEEMQTALDQFRKKRGSPAQAVADMGQLAQMQSQVEQLQRQLMAVQQMKEEEAKQHH